MTATREMDHRPPARAVRAGRAALAGLLCLAGLVIGCDGATPATDDGTPSPTTSPEAPSGQLSAPLETSRVTPRDSSFSVVLPADLLVHPFTSTLMATSADGAYRVFIEARPSPLLEALGQLKDELIGLGFEVVEERHFENATLLTLGHGLARHRLERSVWLVKAGPALTLLCDGLARGYALTRLGTAHRAICQTLTLSPRSPE